MNFEIFHPVSPSSYTYVSSMPSSKPTLWENASLSRLMISSVPAPGWRFVQTPSPLPRIPFCAAFVIPYLSWFLCIFAVSLGLLRHDVRVFRRFMLYMIFTYTLAGLVFLIYPTCFPGRPDPVPGSGALSRLVRLVYRLDPPHNVAPSEHVIVAAGMTAAVFQADRLRRPAFSVPFAALQLLICMSIVFVKQHSALDILGALPVILAGWLLCFRPRKKKRGES